MEAAKQLTELLDLDKQPVAVAFRDSAPAGMTRIEKSAASGCTYWKYAAEGRSFFTEAEDHYGCPVGSHTHGIDLPEEKRTELEGLIGTMAQLAYLDPAEVAGIPQRKEPFRVALYAPLDDAAFQPDVVLVCGNPKQMMLMAEAAHAAGVAAETTMVGRPTCAAIPAVMQSGLAATNLGCIGNRVYTGMDDGELYFAIAGPQLDKVVEKLAVIVHANHELEEFHTARMAVAGAPSG